MEELTLEKKLRRVGALYFADLVKEALEKPQEAETSPFKAIWESSRNPSKMIDLCRRAEVPYDVCVLATCEMFPLVPYMLQSAELCRAIDSAINVLARWAKKAATYEGIVVVEHALKQAWQQHGSLEGKAGGLVVKAALSLLLPSAITAVDTLVEVTELDVGGDSNDVRAQTHAQMADTIRTHVSAERIERCLQLTVLAMAEEELEYEKNIPEEPTIVQESTQP